MAGKADVKRSSICLMWSRTGEPSAIKPVTQHHGLLRALRAFQRSAHLAENRSLERHPASAFDGLATCLRAVAWRQRQPGGGAPARLPFRSRGRHSWRSLPVMTSATAQRSPRRPSSGLSPKETSGSKTRRSRSDRAPDAPLPRISRLSVRRARCASREESRRTACRAVGDP